MLCAPRPGRPGSATVLPNTISPLAQTLKLNGYSTAQFGKCHEVPIWQTSPMGPFNSWPSAGGGFEYFYGFLGGEPNQYYPALYEGTTPIEPTKTPEEGYHFTDDLTTKAIKWVRRRSPGRRSRASSRRTAISPPGPRRSRPGTRSRTTSSRCSPARWRSTPGSSSTPTTNGASAEGSLQGTFNEYVTLSGFGHLETTEFLAEHLDKFGGPEAYNHYAVGWAHAMDTPFQWTKQVASHFGGTRNGTIVHWPGGFDARGEVRSQFSHVIDVAPTVLEAAGIRLDRGDQAPHPVGVLAQVKLPAFDDDVWELYDTGRDWSQARDLVDENPQKLPDLQRLWLIEAVKHNVLPTPTWPADPSSSRATGSCSSVGWAGSPRASVVNTKNKSHAVTAEVEVPESGASGLIVALGGVTGGWSLYAKDGKPHYCHNFHGLERYTVAGDVVIPPGRHQVRMEFDYDGDGIGKGGTVTLYVDGRPAGQGRVDQTEPFVFSADETLDVGNEFGSPVTYDYPTPKTFSGEVDWVEMDVDEAAQDDDHLISPEERLRLIVGLQ